MEDPSVKTESPPYHFNEASFNLLLLLREHRPNLNEKINPYLEKI